MTRNHPEQLVRYIASQLVESPELIGSRTVKIDGGKKIILNVDDDDRGKIIGKGGRTAQALRTIVRAAGAVHDARFQLEIND